MSGDPTSWTPSPDITVIQFTDKQEPAVRAFYAEIERLRNQLARAREALSVFGKIGANLDKDFSDQYAVKVPLNMVSAQFKPKTEGSPDPFVPRVSLIYNGDLRLAATVLKELDQ